MTIQAVVFDIGNVLIEWQPEQFFDRVIGQDRRLAFFAAVPVLEMNERIDAGENFHDAVAEMTDLYPDWSDELSIWRDRWIEMVCPAIDQSVRLLRALRRTGHPVFALSNFGAQTLEMAQLEYPFLEEFDQRYISGELGVIKPNPAIYQLLEDGCGVSPASLLFVDDRPENVAAARARGWQTHLFETSQGWADRLVSEGLLTQEAAA